MRKLLSIFSRSASEPAAVPDQISEAPPSEHGLGQVRFSYEKLTGKEKSHYTDIALDPGHLPKIKLRSKPDNNQYLQIKNDLLDKAFHGLSPFMAFVCGLKGMAGRSDLHDALRRIMRRFLIRYWDMPASADHHHQYLWGFVLHSLDVGCGEAESAQSWTPMSDHGIDEIGQAQDLGMVVLLHFARGLFHDAHKIYQYTMTWQSGSNLVKFDPIHHEGNVLDFKLVYPTNRQEGWASAIPHPGKLNSLEFLSTFPRELWSYAPQNMFFQVNADLFDLVPSQADKESARRDLGRAGRATLEDMIASAITAYFTTEKSKTNPSNHVFRVPGTEWTGVNAAQFFLKIRPVAGGVYSADGVRNCLMEQGLVAGDEENHAVAVPVLIKKPGGKDRVYLERIKIAFIKTAYLQELYPALDDLTGTAAFAAADKEAIIELCPGADCFVTSLVPADQPPTESEKTASNPEVNSESQNKTEPTPQAEVQPQELATSDPILAEYADADWPARLHEILESYSLKDSDPKTGWAFCDLQRVLVRAPQFYQAMTRPELLKAKGWGSIVEGMCKDLAKKNLLDPKIIKGKVNFISEGGDEATISGGFFALKLSDEQHTRILSVLYKSN